MKTCVLALLTLVFLLPAKPVHAQAWPARAGSEVKEKPALTRTLTGHVVNASGAPVSGAVVYLTNTRTMAVKTYITGPDGAYRFPELSPNVDYQVYAQHQDKKSDTKTLSSFDNRSQVLINLKVDTK